VTRAAIGHTYLLTGVTGFLGKVVLEELLRRRDELGVERVSVLIRPKGPFDAEARFAREVAPSPSLSRLPAGWRDAVDVVSGSLDTPGLGLTPAARETLLTQTTRVVHAAASVDFGLPLADAARSNVTTALNMLAVARECRRLDAFVYVSTAYATPHPGEGVPIEETLAPLPEPADAIYRAILDGTAEEEALLARSGHPNTYTLTKSVAEHLLVAQRGSVPLAIVRPSIISASRRHPFPGWIDSVSGFAAFVIFLGMGHMRAVIGERHARLDIIPVDDVATRILLAADSPAAPDEAPAIHHAVAGLAHSPTVQQCGDGIDEFFTLHRVDRLPGVRYVGPAGARYAVADALHHRLPIALARLRSRRARRAGKQVLARIAHLNTAFPYFTERSFAFRSAEPLGGFDPRAYVAIVCRGVYRHLLGRDDTQWTLAGRNHPGHGGDLRWAVRQPRGNLVIRFTAWAVTKVLRRVVAQVTVDLPSFEAARDAGPQGAPLVVVPSHRSYLDFVLCSHLFFTRPDLGVPIPYVAAATEFGRIPILGRVLNSLHAFYLARGPRRENKELGRRVRALLGAGKTLEFFIEGTRSRSREFLTPKRGLLRCLLASGRSCTILPVAICYDRVPEESAFARELAGAPKPRMRLRGLLTWAIDAFRGRVALGRIHITCAAPVRLGPDRDIHTIAREIMDGLRQATITTNFHLRAFLDRHPIEGVDVAWLTRAIEERGGRVLASDLEPPRDLDPLIAGTMRHQFAHLFEAEEPTDEPMRRLLETLFGRPGHAPAGLHGEESVA
jgi:1-acyl-sn-glycerol-3-phosphate acyltransferase